MLYSILEENYVSASYNMEAYTNNNSQYQQDPYGQDQKPVDDTQVNEPSDIFEPVKKILLYNKVKELKFYLNIAEISETDIQTFSEIDNILDVILDFFDLFEYVELVTIINDIVNDISKLATTKSVTKNE